MWDRQQRSKEGGQPISLEELLLEVNVDWE
jgi:hypothetical protein